MSGLTVKIGIARCPKIFFIIISSFARPVIVGILISQFVDYNDYSPKTIHEKYKEPVCI